MAQILFANNARSTLAGAISNVATTAVLATGSGALFPHPSVNQYFILTFQDQLTGLLREIVHVTNVTGDTISLVRAQEGTTALNWQAGDIAAHLHTAGAMRALQGRQLLLAAGNFYCNFGTGSDSTGDGSVGNPWKTVQFTNDFLVDNIDGGGQAVVINQAGADTDGLAANRGIPGVNAISLVIGGSIATSASAAILVTGTARFDVSGTGTIQGAAFDLAVDKGGYASIRGVTVEACSAAKIFAQDNSTLVIAGGYTDTGNAANHWYVDDTAIISVLSSTTVTLTGTPAYSGSFASAHTGGVINCGSATFSGAATGKRFDVDTAGGISTNNAGPNFLPGDAPGTITPPGWYDTEATFNPATFQTGGFRNKVRNATCAVATRGSVTVSPGSPVYTLDGFIVGCAGATVTVSQGTNSVFRSLNCLHVVGQAGVTDLFVIIPIESIIAAPLAGQGCVFQAKCHNDGAAVTPTLTLKHPTTSDVGSTTAWNTSVTDLAAGALEPCPAGGAVTPIFASFTANASVVNGMSLRLDFGAAVGSGSFVIDLADFDLSISAPILSAGGLSFPELRDVSAEVLQCARYLPALAYGNLSAAIQNATSTPSPQADVVFPFATTTRIAPTSIASSAASTFTLSKGGMNNACTGIAFSNAGVSGGLFTLADSGNTYTVDAASVVGLPSGTFIYWIGAELNGSAI